MSRLLDPTICPDCRAPLDLGATCTGCGLRLTGPLAPRLWEAMVAADGLVERLRSAAPLPSPPRAAVVLVPAGPVTAPSSATFPSSPAAGAGPTSPRLPPPSASPPAAPRRAARRLPPLSVPVVLLSLGALCLMVAAVVFVAVTWGSLGLSGRTLVLLGFTALMSGVATVLTRKNLRGAAETFWLIVAGMLTVDLLAARSAGLLGLDTLSWRHTGLLVGVCVAALGVGVALWVRQQPVTALWGMQLAAVAGAVVATVSGAWLAENPAIGTALATPLLAGAATLLRRRLVTVAAGIGGIAAITWSGLAVIGGDRALEVATWSHWWSELRGWPLLVASLYAAAGAVTPRLPLTIRRVLAGLALVPVVVLVNAPDTPGFADRDSLVRAATLVAVSLLVRFGPTVWACAAGAIAALGSVVLGLQVLVAPWTSLALLPDHAAIDARTPPLEVVAAGWTHAVVAVAVGIALWSLLRLAPAPHHGVLRPVALLAGTTVACTGLVDLVVGARPPLWMTVAVLVVSSVLVGTMVWALRRPEPESLGASVSGSFAAAYLVVMSLVAASPSPLLTGLATTAFTLTLALGLAATERRGAAVFPAVTGTSAVLMGAGALLAWLDLGSTQQSTTAYALCGYAGAVVLAAGHVTRRGTSRIALESATAVTALGAILIAPAGADRALVLGLVGLFAAVLAVTRHDRSQLAWAAAVAGACATVVRITGTDLAHPELYLLPVGLLLVGGGLWRRSLRVDDESDTVLGAGLAHGCLVLLAVVAGYPFDLTATVVVTLGGLGAAVLYAALEARRAPLLAPATVGLSMLLGGEAVVGWCSVLGLGDLTGCLALATYAVLVALVASPASRLPASRVTVECCALVLALASLGLAPEERTGALALAVVGTGAALLAVLNRDRALVGWLALAAVGASTLIRLDLGVRAPELYVVPAGAALLAAGLVRLRRGDRSWVTSTLGSGLAAGYLTVLTTLADTTGNGLAATIATTSALALIAVFALVEGEDAPVEGPVAAVLATLAGLTALLTWTDLLDAGRAATVLSLAVYAGVVGVLASPGTRRLSSRVALEAVATLIGVAAVMSAPDDPSIAMVLTILGTAIAVVAVTNRDRVQAGWIGTAVLGLATVIRVGVHAQAPELYTLPAALLLLAAGLWRLRVDRDISSVAALGSGLTLALVPSLLLAIDEPVSLRGALTGVGAVLVLGFGVQQRLTAPFLAGAATTALLALRHLEPVAGALPRWISLGVLGFALLTVGITWEARLRDLRSARRYLVALR